MLPLKDLNPTSRRAVVTIALIAACVAVFLLVQPRDSLAEARFTFRHAAIPDEIVTGQPITVREAAVALGSPRAAVTVCRTDVADASCFAGKDVWIAVVVSLFLHGSWSHLIGNMLFLWVFGNNVEDRLGPVRFTAFYLLAGIVATIAQVLVSTSSTVPIIGASGAIAAVMGAYAVWFPRARVLTLFFMGIVWFWPVRAWLLLVAWFVLQFFTDPNSGVAWVAHVGGFAFGALVALAVGRPPVRAAGALHA